MVVDSCSWMDSSVRLTLDFSSSIASLSFILTKKHLLIYTLQIWCLEIFLSLGWLPSRVHLRLKNRILSNLVVFLSNLQIMFQLLLL